MNVLDATRQWLRAECPLIDRKNRFNANYIGADATEYTLRTGGESHRQNLWGADIATYDLVFEAVLPYGTATAPNIAAADLFAGLSAWLRGAAAAHNYPAVTGYEADSLTVSNAGLITTATAATARYQLQIKLVLKER